MLKKLKIHEAFRVIMHGQVQGVGFRPSIYRLAKNEGVKGCIANSPSGIILEIEGTSDKIKSFFSKLRTSIPKNAKLTRLIKNRVDPSGFSDFSISESIESGDISVDIPPDLSICPECLKELSNSSDRRSQYPFINCTDCGPRFTIIKKLPYDRPKTTMSGFSMCPQCRKEYSTPESRRFHAQPNACHVCGPQLLLTTNTAKTISRKETALKGAIQLLKNGNIVAIKSLGGYHLSCDASKEASVIKLRERKSRPFKPLALMLADVESAKKLCYISSAEEKVLTSNARPIVLLRKRPGGEISTGVNTELIAPGNAYLGIMLPYTPLHFLLLSGISPKERFSALVMTSANIKDEPICRTERDLKEKLWNIADFALVHNRTIHNRCDDSIVQVVGEKIAGVMAIRRSRGYVPQPIQISKDNFKENPDQRCIFSAGAELKNTFCLTRENKAYVSQFIGDLDNAEAFLFYKEAFNRLKTFLKIKPNVVAYDLHPDLMSTLFAKSLIYSKTLAVPVQHHTAHIASVLAEKNIKKPVIGFAFDGTGYGTDGKIWGSECFLWDGKDFRRLAHFEYFPLPGGDVSTKEIWRVAVGLLKLAGIRGIPSNFKNHPVKEIAMMIDRDINSPDCCSVGRLFDAVAALSGIRDEVTFEAQAAIELESLALNEMDNISNKGYNFDIFPKKKIAGVSLGKALVNEPLTVSLSGIVKGVLDDRKEGKTPGAISYRFHLTLAEIVNKLSVKFAEKYGVSDVVLSGGVFQNKLLLSLSEKMLGREGLKVHYNIKVPPNDGGISLGQAWIASKEVKR